MQIEEMEVFQAHHAMSSLPPGPSPSPPSLPLTDTRVESLADGDGVSGRR